MLKRIFSILVPFTQKSDQFIGHIHARLDLRAIQTLVDRQSSIENASTTRERKID